MIDPSSIPHNVMRAARSVTDIFYKSDTGHKRNLTLHIAREILAERQNCTDVAAFLASEGAGADQVYFALTEQSA